MRLEQGDHHEMTKGKLRLIDGNVAQNGFSKAIFVATITSGLRNEGEIHQIGLPGASLGSILDFNWGMSVKWIGGL